MFWNVDNVTDCTVTSLNDFSQGKLPVASENSIRPDRHLIGLFSALLVGRENSLFFEKIPCYGSKNSLFRCVGNFSAKH